MSERVKPHIFTAEEKAFMEEYVPGHHYREIQEEFNKRFAPQISLEQIKSYIGNHKLNTGFNGQFEKGIIPPNKGKKLTPEQYRRSAPTMFKPGQLPPNTDPIGTEKELADGYIWVKINDQPKARKNVNWIQKHRLIWQQHNGPIPEDHVIIFKDGDRRNFDINNLTCITRAENVRMNQARLRSADPAATETAIAIAKIKTKVGSMRSEKKAKERMKRDDNKR